MFLAGSKVKKPLAKALASVSKGWSLMAVVSGLFYLLFVVFFAYPKPITERPKEYGFAVLLILTIYCAIVLVIYTILNLSQEIEKGLEEAGYDVLRGMSREKCKGHFL